MDPPNGQAKIKLEFSTEKSRKEAKHPVSCSHAEACSSWKTRTRAAPQREQQAHAEVTHWNIGLFQRALKHFCCLNHKADFI